MSSIEERIRREKLDLVDFSGAVIVAVEFVFEDFLLLLEALDFFLLLDPVESETGAAEPSPSYTNTSTTLLDDAEAWFCFDDREDACRSDIWALTKPEASMSDSPPLKRPILVA